jgi:biopolymer transport protein ExbD
MLLGKREREDAEVPGSSLADIAFLLLIFFLLVTHINVDTGIGLVLPPKPKPNQPPPKIKKRNILDILVNSQGQVLINDTPTPISQVKQKVKSFINNKGQNPNLSDSPKKAVVSIKTSRQTTYAIYISMIDKVVGAYQDLRNAASQTRYGKNYDQLKNGSAAQKAIQKLYPKQISIAKPESSS